MEELQRFLKESRGSLSELNEHLEESRVLEEQIKACTEFIRKRA